MSKGDLLTFSLTKKRTLPDTLVQNLSWKNDYKWAIKMIKKA